LLTRRVSNFFDRSREHWLFVPLFALLILSFVYVFFIGEKGYLAYRVKLKEKIELKAQIQQFSLAQKELRQKIQMLKNKDLAIQKFSKDFHLLHEKVRILKFRESTEDKLPEYSATADLAATQKIYTICATLVIALLTLFFYRRNIAHMNLDRVRPFELGES